MIKKIKKKVKTQKLTKQLKRDGILYARGVKPENIEFLKHTKTDYGFATMAHFVDAIVDSFRETHKKDKR